MQSTVNTIYAFFSQNYLQLKDTQDSFEKSMYFYVISSNPTDNFYILPKIKKFNNHFHFLYSIYYILLKKKKKKKKKSPIVTSD